MAIEVGVVFAILTMLSWGIADFLAKKAIDRIGYKKSLLINQSIALGPIFVYAILFFNIPEISTSLILITIATAFLALVGYLSFYKGLQKGNISVVSPITSSWAVVTTLLAIVIFGETLSSLQIVGVLGIFIGIFLTSTNLKEFKKSIRQGTSNGVLEAIIAMVSWGLTFLLVKPIVDAAGPVMAVLFLRAIMLVFLFSWVRISRTKIGIPTKLIFLFLIGSGLLDVFGFVTYSIGITTEFLSIVSPIVAIFPAVTIMLAYVFLKERLVNNQKIGIVTILTGLVLISLI